MLQKQIMLVNFGRRYVTTFSRSFSTKTASKLDKTLLKELRQKTGFSFAKINEALKLHENDSIEAAKWLHEQAEKEGLKKVSKLQGRSTNQGLVGVLIRNNYAALVELACETDFVARNDLFKELVSTTAESTIEFRQAVIEQNQKINSFDNADISHLREVLMTYELENLKSSSSGTTLQESLVSVVGKIGENIKIKRALSIATSQSNVIAASVHGSNSSSHDACLVGNFAAAVVLKPIAGLDVQNEKLSTLAKNISHHVIGMNPVSIEPCDNVKEEDALISQEYLLDDKVTVGELLRRSNAECVDFVRYGVNE